MAYTNIEPRFAMSAWSTGQTVCLYVLRLIYIDQSPLSASVLHTVGDLLAPQADAGLPGGACADLAPGSWGPHPPPGASPPGEPCCACCALPRPAQTLGAVMDMSSKNAAAAVHVTDFAGGV